LNYVNLSTTAAVQELFTLIIAILNSAKNITEEQKTELLASFVGRFVEIALDKTFATGKYPQLKNEFDQKLEHFNNGDDILKLGNNTFAQFSKEDLIKYTNEAVEEVMRDLLDQLQENNQIDADGLQRAQQPYQDMLKSQQIAQDLMSSKGDATPAVILGKLAN